MWKLSRDQADEPHYEIVVEDNRSEDKEGGDDSGAAVWVHAGKKYH